MKNFTLSVFCIVFFVYTNSYAQGNLQVKGLGVTITNGDTTPSTVDDTDYGTVTIGGSNANIFNIANTGNSDLGNITISISGAGAGHFSPTSLNIGKIKKNKNANHTITYSPTTSGPHIATVTITSSNTGVDVPYSFTIQGNTPYTGPEINVTGNGATIFDGDTTPTTADHTDFGTVAVSGSFDRTFTIQNTGSAVLNIYSVSSNIGDFTILTAPSSTVAAGSSTTFVVRFSPFSAGTKVGTLSIANDDIDESTYDFRVTGDAFVPVPEINVTGNAINIVDGDTTPTVTDHTDFGSIDVSSTFDRTYTIQNTGVAVLNIWSVSSNIGDFTILTAPSSTLAAGSSTTFVVRFSPFTVGTKTATLTIANDDSDESTYDYRITGFGTTPAPEINIQGNTNTIVDGDTTPSLSDDTDFGTVDIAGGTNTNIFTIQNTGTLNLTLNGLFPYVTIGGANPLDFILTAIPNTSISPAGSTTFAITFNPSVLGLRTANVTIANNDSDENPYNFNIQGTGFVPPPCGNSVMHTANFETGLDGWTSGGIDATRVNDATWSYNGNYSLRVRDDDASGNASSFLSPVFDLTNYNKIDFKFFFKPYSMDSAHSGTGTKTYTEELYIEYSSDGGTTWAIIATYESGIIAGNKTGDFDSTTTAIGYGRIATMLSSNHSFVSNGQFRVRCDASADDDMVYVDDITISGTAFCTPTEAPGGSTNGLDLWLKADQVDGISYAADGSAVSQWADNGKGNSANVMVSGQEPVYRNNVASNFNFNPVIDFENDNTTANADMTYVINDGSRQELQGTGGFNTNDVFVVLMPDPTITNTMIPLDVFTSSDPNTLQYSEDVTGFGFGSYSARFINERLSYCIGTTNESSSSNPSPSYDNGYGIADTNSTTDYNKIQIVNVRQNASDTDMELYFNANQVGNESNDLAKYAMINNTRFWLGRSQYWNGSFDGRIAEVITYNTRRTDANLTQERNRVQSYLAIKYGITLGVNGTSQDYVDSDGSIIWDQSINSGFNYDIAGIGRDDVAELNQKQSSSSNNATDGTGPIEGLLTIGLTDIYDTNNDNKTFNTNTLNDKDYLVWGNNNASLEAAPNYTSVDMSAGITGLSTPVSFYSMQRVWKVVENGSDIAEVMVSIPQNAVRNITPPGNYYMFASDTPVFDPTADYREMKLNAGVLEALYDFDGTKYITFGYAPQVIVERSVYFDGAGDYVDMDDNFDLDTSAFTLSAWINRTASSVNSSILSKRDVAFTEGYDFKINALGKLEFSVKNGVLTETVTSNTTIPIGKWHQVAVIFDGTNASLYIDGVFDNNGTITAPINNDQSFFLGAAGKSSPMNYYQGNIDEVRIWSAALLEDQLHFLMNQELEENTNFVSGKVMPTTITKNDAALIPWTSLEGYYPMSIYTYTNTNDESNNNRQGALRNLNTVDYQSAPLPYKSTTNGDWDTNASWVNGSAQIIPGSTSIVDNTKTVDWNIVETSHDITIDNSSLPVGKNNNRKVLSLDVKANKLTVIGDTSTGTGNGLTISHYLSLDGKIDLNGESQLIQSLDSDLKATSSGTLERDQQGTQDLFTYNYWSSPVGAPNNTTNNNSYTVPQIFNDGTNPNLPLTINFITNSYNGTPPSAGTPIGIADYWIWKYGNLAPNYYNWQHVRSTGSLKTGEGFTMKGVANTSGNVLLNQNYVLEGKPNNGEITLNIDAGSDYLVGNPYASALDAHEFIMDNAPNIEGTGNTTGTLYFWEHWGGGSHNLAAYQGGYATYNLSGAVPAASFGTNDPAVATGGTPSKLPGRYIPVSQGFFVKGEATGTIKFNNSQRAFEKEGSNSIFVRTSAESTTANNDNLDNRLKIRLGLNSASGLHRQLLVTQDTNATSGYDWGYDGESNDTQKDDMHWMINNIKCVIQGTDIIDANTILPLALITDAAGDNTFTIDAIENVPADLDIFLHDILNATYHDLKQADFTINLAAGQYFNRFEVVFSNPDALSVDDLVLISDINTYYSNTLQSIVIHNPKLNTILSVDLYNILGQQIINFTEIENKDYLELNTNKLSTGTYIIKLKTDDGEISKKVLVE